MSAVLTAKQEEARDLLSGSAAHNMLYGGSRSGKTFIILRAQITRRLKSKSNGATLRYRFNHLKASVILQTFPKVMQLCYPDLREGVDWELNKSDWYAEFYTGSRQWFGGLDEKERVEKVLGQEHSDVFLNECSQIGFDERSTAVTRIAEKAMQQDGREMRIRFYYDCNPPNKGHWTYKMFVEGKDPVSGAALANQHNYQYLLMNPQDNAANLSADYIEELENLPERHRKRFLLGQFADANPSALFSQDHFDRARQTEAPELVRVVVAVDPSGASDDDAADHDEIGIVVAGLGVDGKGYLLEDVTISGGPDTWAQAAVSAYERHEADRIVAETNYGGAMVESVIRAKKRDVPYTEVKASRGKTVRAEPISALVEQGKIRHVGKFVKLEDELLAFSTSGYTGERSPNRADAYVWAFSSLFPGIVAGHKERKKKATRPRARRLL